MSLIVLDVGVWMESAYPPDTSPPSVVSPGYPAAAAPTPTAHLSTTSSALLLHSASSHDASPAPAADPRPPARSRLLRRRSAAHTPPAAYAHTCSPPRGSPSKDARQSPRRPP